MSLRVSPILVLTTAPDVKTARNLARSLVSRRLAACVSMNRGAVSYYRWKGKVERAGEVMLTIKTVSSRFAKIQQFIESHHPYELPEVIALPVKKGSPRYLAWLKGAVCLALAVCLFAPRAASAADTISFDELRSLQGSGADFLLLDARGKPSYDAGHIEGAVLLAEEIYYTRTELFQQNIIGQAPDFSEALAQRMNVYSPQKPIVTYCNDHCGLARTLATQLRQIGFRDVRVLEPGFQSWEGKSYPVAKTQKSGL